MAYTSPAAAVTTSNTPNSTVVLYDQAFIIGNGSGLIMDQFATKKIEVAGKQIQITKYPRLPTATTSLSETGDPAPTPLVDQQVTFKPLEYGQYTVRTDLSVIWSGGKLDLAIPEVMGQAAGSTEDQLVCMALDVSTNVITANSKTMANLASTDILNRQMLQQAYNYLNRRSIPKVNGMYVAVVHPDVASDLKNDTSVGGFIDLSKYTNPNAVLMNEIGSFAGFRIITNPNATYGSKALNTASLSIYNSYFFGAGAYAKAVSAPVSFVCKADTDALDRNTIVGWKGTFVYGILDQDCLLLGKTVSSFSTNDK